MNGLDFLKLAAVLVKKKVQVQSKLLSFDMAASECPQLEADTRRLIKSFVGRDQDRLVRLRLRHGGAWVKMAARPQKSTSKFLMAPLRCGLSLFLRVKAMGSENLTRAPRGGSIKVRKLGTKPKILCDQEMLSTRDADCKKHEFSTNFDDFKSLKA